MQGRTVTKVNKTTISLAVLVALVSLPSANAQGSCFACPEFCTDCSWADGVLTITKARNGY